MTTEVFTPHTRQHPRRGNLGALREYFGERFPVPIVLLVAVATALATSATAQAATLGVAPLVIDGDCLAAAAMVFLFLLLLRVVDEHKDFALDAATRPDRPVQRGVVSLRQLKVLGGVAVAAQVALALTGELGAAAMYGLPLGYAVLMYYEFFVAEWFARHLVWSALSQCAVMALVALALGARVTTDPPVELWAFLALCVSTFLAVDVLRKTWAPDSEVDGRSSYSQRYGVRGATRLGAALVLVSTLLGGWIGLRLGGGFAWIAVLVAVTGWGIYELVAFAEDPCFEREARLGAVAGVHLLTLYFGIAACAAVSRGVTLVAH